MSNPELILLALSREAYEGLRDFIENTMQFYRPNRHGSDWSCLHCGMNPHSDREPWKIPHRTDCFGLELLQKLDT